MNKEFTNLELVRMVNGGMSLLMITSLVSPTVAPYSQEVMAMNFGFYCLKKLMQNYTVAIKLSQVVYLSKL